MTKMFSKILMVIIASALLVFPIAAQQLTGSLSGRVIDESDEALPGCTLTLESPALLGTKNYVCAGDGKFRFPALPPGTYSLTAEMTGFKKLTLEGIVISVGKATVITLKLEVSPIQEEITVTSAAPMVDVKSTKVTVNYARALLENIPL